MHSWVKAIEASLLPLANDQNAKFMSAYMKGQFSFYGIKSTPRREAVKPLFSSKLLPSTAELPMVVDELWSLPEREYQMVAVDLLIKQKNKLPDEMLKHVEHWITTKSWWDTVDMLATHIIGSFCLRYPQQSANYIDKWRKSDNIWLRRTTILYQLKYKEKTDVKTLFAIIEENLNDKEFFIQKAIGWSLREYSKTDATTVIQFIEQKDIQGLAKREGLKWVKSSGLIS